MTEQQADHKAEALRLLTEGCGFKPDDLLDACHHVLLAVLVHSNLAIAEGQERVATELALLRSVFEQKFDLLAVSIADCPEGKS